MKEVIRWVEDYEEVDPEWVIIRCKDCKYKKKDRCKYMTYIICENDYCSQAKRKEE